ncbi:high-affinity nickel-transport protein-domain-containing protein [Bombardia bombarda]|uniref:Nickel/cobalt efflux system n=1 Tax=Bombardia bombarda TaxID=252184 RepID=A0AA39XBK8_9PEZI|nr:high-affinity nickel-transport protein-domain-containing protein [Bombardia bombarda]
MARLRLPHIRIPFPTILPGPLSAIPPPALKLITLLIAVNVVIWAGVGAVLHYFPKMITPAVLSYTLGLRHALDADHISAIDLMTRRLIASGQRPVSVGTFFSLGHSTIVVVTCIVGRGIIGTSVSAAFLLLLCAGNGWVLWKLVKRLKVVLAEERARREDAGSCGDGVVEGSGADDGGAASAGALNLEGAGFMANLFRKVFRIVDRPWKMFPLGLLFGLGFDTSSEIAILGIASVQGAQGTSIWLILIFPILFTAGMCLLDTTDGALMMALYTSKAFARDAVAILYYSIVLTGITVFVSAFIGIVQLLSLIYNVAEPEGPFWDGVEAIGDHFDIIGGSICGVFVLVGLGSVLVYRPWRRRMDGKAQRQPLREEEQPLPES